VGSIRSAWRDFITAVGLLSYPGIKYGCESSQLWMEAVTISDSSSRSEFSGGTAESAAPRDSTQVHNSLLPYSVMAMGREW